MLQIVDKEDIISKVSHNWNIPMMIDIKEKASAYIPSSPVPIAIEYFLHYTA